MDTASDANNQPCCSKSLHKEPPNSVKYKFVNDIIELDDDDSCDSAYETGSARSTLSSPTADLKDMSNSGSDSKDTQKPIHVYANVHYEEDIVAPWRLCLYKHEYITTNSPRDLSSTIVISDSDDDDAPTFKQTKHLNSTMNSSEPIILDSDSDEEVESTKYHVVEIDGNTKKIPDYYLANVQQPDPYIKLRPKTRVIARRRQVGFPATWDEKGQMRFLYQCDDLAYFAGIISGKSFEENGHWNYLIFFDDGHVQYVSDLRIRVVFGNYQSRYVHKNAHQFYDYYFNAVARSANKLIELVLEPGQHVRVHLNGKFERAKVLKYETGLVWLNFEKSIHAECLYSGSPRFENVWQSIIKNDRLGRYHQMNITLIEVSSDSEDEEDDYKSPQKQPLPKNARDPSQKIVRLQPEKLIDDYKQTRKLDRQHICGRACVREFEANRKIFEFDPLKRPLLAGWTRKRTGICHYIAPCGRPFNTIETLYKYLLITRSKLTIDCFTFSSYLDCMTEVRSHSETGRTYYVNDLIPGGWKEKQQIPVIPIADNVPFWKEYVIRNHRNPRSKKVPAILNEDDNPFRSGCDCTDDCSIKSKCSCWKLTLDGQRGQAGYRYKRLEGRVDTGIYECNPSCKCSSKCLNRVVSAQVEQKLELYETKNRGYGIRCQNDIPRGTFVSCYFGDLLHGKTADERAMKKIGSIFGDEYFMQLDHIEIAEQYKDGYESDVDSVDLNELEDVMPLKRFKLDETLMPTPPLLSGTNQLLNYFPDIIKRKVQNETNQRTILFGENSVEFVVDGRYRGNISRFYNHSCQPNLFSQTVFKDHHDLRFPWLAFFAAEDIKAGTELTWDYGYLIGSIEGRQMECRCGAPNCRKRLL